MSRTTEQVWEELTDFRKDLAPKIESLQRSQAELHTIANLVKWLTGIAATMFVSGIFGAGVLVSKVNSIDDKLGETRADLKEFRTFVGSEVEKIRSAVEERPSPDAGAPARLDPADRALLARAARRLNYGESNFNISLSQDMLIEDPSSTAVRLRCSLPAPVDGGRVVSVSAAIPELPGFDRRASYRIAARLDPDDRDNACIVTLEFTDPDNNIRFKRSIAEGGPYHVAIVVRTASVDGE